jgi:hypothetical protein
MKKQILFVVGALSVCQSAGALIQPKKTLHFTCMPRSLGSRFATSFVYTPTIVAGLVALFNFVLRKKNPATPFYYRHILSVFGVVAVLGASHFSAASVSTCLEQFSLAYNDFLAEPLLNSDEMVFKMQLRAHLTSWQLVDIAARLEWLMRDLAVAISYAEQLLASSVVQAEGRDVMDLLSIKLSVLRQMLQVAASRMEQVKNDPLFVFQKQIKDRYDSQYKLIGLQARQLAEQEYLMNYANYTQSPYFVSVSTERDYCGLCARQVAKNERYATKCQCLPGSYFYHHACISSAIKRNADQCPQCFGRATVHSAFGDGGVAAEPFLAPVVLPVPSAPAVVAEAAPYDRTTCTLFLGKIVSGKAYKTSCGCPSGKYSYHHECIKTKLAERNACPKCAQSNPAVHSNFGDGFENQQNEAPITLAPVYSPAPSAPVVDTLNTCALCTGQIPQNKRYKAICINCVEKYYHHECLAGTLKQNGNCCPFCGVQNIAVHSAF